MHLLGHSLTDASGVVYRCGAAWARGALDRAFECKQPPKAHARSRVKWDQDLPVNVEALYVTFDNDSHFVSHLAHSNHRQIEECSNSSLHCSVENMGQIHLLCV